MPRRTAPPPVPSSNVFNDKTRTVHDEELVNQIRVAAGPGGRSNASGGGGGKGSLFDEPTRLGDMDADLIASTKRDDAPRGAEYPPKFLDASTEIDPRFAGQKIPNSFGGPDEEATRMANVDVMAKQKSRAPAARRGPPPPGVPPTGKSPAPIVSKSPPPMRQDDSTRAVDIRNDPAARDPNIDGVDWDID